MKFAKLYDTDDGNQILGIVRYKEEMVVLEAITTLEIEGEQTEFIFELGRFPNDKMVSELYEKLLSKEMLFKLYETMRNKANSTL